MLGTPTRTPPSTKATLERLERVSRDWTKPLFPDVAMDEDEWDFTIASGSSGMVFYFNQLHSVLLWRIVR